MTKRPTFMINREQESYLKDKADISMTRAELALVIEEDETPEGDAASQRLMGEFRQALEDLAKTADRFPGEPVFLVLKAE